METLSSVQGNFEKEDQDTGTRRLPLLGLNIERGGTIGKNNPTRPVLRNKRRVRRHAYRSNQRRTDYVSLGTSGHPRRNERVTFYGERPLSFEERICGRGAIAKEKPIP